MITSLLHLIFHIAAVALPEVAKHLGEYPFQCIVGGRMLFVGWGVAVIADIEGGAMKVAAVCCGIAIAALKSRHILLRTQHTGHDNLMQGYLLDE